MRRTLVYRPTVIVEPGTGWYTDQYRVLVARRVNDFRLVRSFPTLAEAQAYRDQLADGEWVDTRCRQEPCRCWHCENACQCPECVARRAVQEVAAL